MELRYFNAISGSRYVSVRLYSVKSDLWNKAYFYKILKGCKHKISWNDTEGENFDNSGGT